MTDGFGRILDPAFGLPQRSPQLAPEFDPYWAVSLFYGPGNTFGSAVGGSVGPVHGVNVLGGLYASRGILRAGHGFTSGGTGGTGGLIVPSRYGWALRTAHDGTTTGSGTFEDSVLSWYPSLTTGSLIVVFEALSGSVNSSGSNIPFAYGTTPLGSGSAKFLEINNFSDGNLYAGWFDGAWRLITSATGLWSTGDLVVMAVTWDASAGQDIWINGVQKNSTATITTTNLTGDLSNTFFIGGDGSTTGGFTHNILGIAVLDRRLNAVDLGYIQQNPLTWAFQPSRQFDATAAPPTTTTNIGGIAREVLVSGPTTKVGSVVREVLVGGGHVAVAGIVRESLIGGGNIKVANVSREVLLQDPPLTLSKLVGYAVSDRASEIDVPKLIGYAIADRAAEIEATKIVSYAILNPAPSVFSANITESSSLSDSFNGLNTASRTISESSSLSDTFRVVGKLYPRVTESVSVSDVVALHATDHPRIIESFTATETLTRRLTLHPIIRETFIPKEHLSQRVPKKTFALNTAEKALLADIISAKKKQVWNLHILETVVVSETLNTRRLFNRTVLEQTIPGDTISAKNKQIWNLNVLESSPSPQDLISLHTFLNRTVLELARIDDGISAQTKQIWNLNIVEAVPVQDLITRKTLFNRLVIEQVNPDDVIQTEQIWNLNIQEASPPSEILTTFARFNRILADQIFPNDLIAATIRSTLNLTVLEGVPAFELFDDLDAFETINMVVIDQALLADLSDSTLRSTLNLTILEGVLPSEGTNPLAGSNMTNSEHVTVTDAFIAAVNRTLNFNITEAAAIAEIVQLTAEFNRALVDQTELVDNFAAATTRIFIRNLDILEGSPIGDVVGTNHLFNCTLPEQIAIADLVSARLDQIWNLNILEGVSPGEIANPFSLFNLTVPERTSIDDLIPAELTQIWNLTTLEGTVFGDQLDILGGMPSVWDVSVAEVDLIQESPDIVRIHFTRDIVAVFLLQLLADPAYARFVSPTAALARLLLLIEIIRAYLAEIGTVHEAKALQRVLTKFISAIKTGNVYAAATETTHAVAHPLRMLVVHVQSVDDDAQLITPPVGAINYSTDIVARFYATVVAPQPQYQGFDDAPVWHRLLTMIEVLRAYFIDVETPREVTTAHHVIDRMIATIKFGGYLNE